ncbi:MAG TPA: tRNA (N(6)-L-threonylcarbamoyladenosine(37)-C(2))-methylthiotransferase MtaB [Elusimicrobiales bacterium]|nr:tRNA (N(6)-L-threonylcarbamoyladenosine(37)-C(2))-methylthiotransferase MtaB [Elusimicrobiales bacterium]
MKVFIKTFGCRVNQIETQSILEHLLKHGYDQTSDFKKSDVCILNTCTVTEKADRDVEKMLRQITFHNPTCKLIVAGCYATMHPEKVLETASQALIVSNVKKSEIPKILNIKKISKDFTVTRQEKRLRAFVKIQDGCIQKCSYCIVRNARSVLWSKPVKKTLEEIKNLILNEHKEIVLSGINIGSYRCPDTEKDLADLAEEIFKLEGDFRIRFSSIEVHSITDKLIRVVSNAGDKFCNYFHIPLQSGSDKVLRDMNRNYDTTYYLKKVNFLRTHFKNIGIFADVIAGYPTEKKEHFEETVDFVKKIGFSGLHVFSYSKRPYTDAFKLKTLPVATVKQRSKALRDLDKNLRRKFAESLIGTTQKVLIENVSPSSKSARAGGNCASGLASNFQKVMVCTSNKSQPQFAPNQFVLAKIISVAGYICLAKPHSF